MALCGKDSIMRREAGVEAAGGRQQWLLLECAHGQRLLGTCDASHSTFYREVVAAFKGIQLAVQAPTVKWICHPDAFPSRLFRVAMVVKLVVECPSPRKANARESLRPNERMQGCSQRHY